MGPLFTLLAVSSCAPEMTQPEQAQDDLSNPTVFAAMETELNKFSNYPCPPELKAILEKAHESLTGVPAAESDAAFICLNEPARYEGMPVDVLVQSDGLGDTFALTMPHEFEEQERENLVRYWVTCADTKGCFGLSLDEKNSPHVFPPELQTSFDEKLRVAGVEAPPSVILDSALTREQAMAEPPCEIPQEISSRQKLIEVQYWGLTEDGKPDEKIHQGQIVVDETRVTDTKEIFDLAFDSRFPIHSVIPVSQFDWHDAKSMKANNTSGFNYRHTGSAKICPGKASAQSSRHASVRPGEMAIDINDRQNPYCTEDAGGKRCEPEGAVYNAEAPGTLTPESAIVKVATARKGSEVKVNLCSGNEWVCTPQEETHQGLGWVWGGNWNHKDWQHLQFSAETK